MVSEPKQEAPEQGTDEMDMGDMDKLEQDTGNIGEVFFVTLESSFHLWYNLQ